MQKHPSINNILIGAEIKTNLTYSSIRASQPSAPTELRPAIQSHAALPLTHCSVCVCICTVCMCVCLLTLVPSVLPLTGWPGATVTITSILPPPPSFFFFCVLTDRSNSGPLSPVLTLISIHWYASRICIAATHLITKLESFPTPPLPQPRMFSSPFEIISAHFGR